MNVPDNNIENNQKQLEHSPRHYSTAFEKMTKNDHNDLVGLVAYARYKQMVRDEVLQGQRIAGTPKNPSEQVVEFYRNAARQELQNFAAYAIDEAAQEIQQSAILDRVDRATSEIQAHISNSTGSLRAIVTNVIAWVFTLFISLLALIALQQPAFFESLRETIPPATESSSEDNDVELDRQ